MFSPDAGLISGSAILILVNPSLCVDMGPKIELSSIQILVFDQWEIYLILKLFLIKIIYIKVSFCTS